MGIEEGWEYGGEWVGIVIEILRALEVLICKSIRWIDRDFLFENARLPLLVPRLVFRASTIGAAVDRPRFQS